MTAQTTPPETVRLQRAEGPVSPPPAGTDVDPHERGQPRWYRLGKRLLGYGVLVFFALLYVMPFLLALANSFKARPEALSNPLGLVPAAPTLRAYEIMAQTQIPRWALNSVIVSVCVTLGRLFLCSLAGYALARLRFPGRKVVFAGVVAVLAVPPIVLAIPRYLVLGQLGLLDTYAGMILPLAIDAFGIFLMKQFFESVPREMEEAAKVDGATIFQTYWRIVLPLAAPGLIALTILGFQGSWNEFLHPLIAVPNEQDLRTLPVGLALLRGAQGEALDYPLLLGASLLTTIPVAIIFFVFQRYFMQGVASSGVKG